MTSLVPVQLHAKLSASGSAKWLTCTPSARMEEPFADQQSAFSEEGTYMHFLFANDVLRFLDRHEQVLPIPEELRKYDSRELQDHVKDASDRAIALIDDARRTTPDSQILVEQRVDFSPWVPQGWGTGDLIIVADGVIAIADLKGGKGIPVSAVDNSQMRLYALGALHQFGHLYDIERVRMTILQPRLDNYSSDEIAVADLLHWAEHVVKPRAQLAWAGEGELVPGEHCSKGFCRARFQCPARAQVAHRLAQEDFALKAPELLTIDQIADVLSKADMAIDWLNDVKSYALKEAERGTPIPGFKLVEGRSNRKYVDQDAVAQRLLDAGIPEPLIYERSLLGITAMEKAIGKKKFAELLDDLVIKPLGKPTLVPQGDKRVALTSAASAAEDFQ